MPTTSTRALPSLCLALIALGLGAWLGAGARAQEARAPRFEYRLEPWTVEDTTAVLRAVTGDQLTPVDQLAQTVERGSEPVDDPRVQAAVHARLEARLAALGADGWEVFWIGDSRTVVAGVLLPAPRVFAKRRAG